MGNLNSFLYLCISLMCFGSISYCYPMYWEANYPKTQWLKTSVIYKTVRLCGLISAGLIYTALLQGRVVRTALLRVGLRDSWVTLPHVSPLPCAIRLAQACSTLGVDVSARKSKPQCAITFQVPASNLPTNIKLDKSKSKSQAQIQGIGKYTLPLERNPTKLYGKGYRERWRFRVSSSTYHNIPSSLQFLEPLKIFSKHHWFFSS